MDVVLHHVYEGKAARRPFDVRRILVLGLAT